MKKIFACGAYRFRPDSVTYLLKSYDFQKNMWKISKKICRNYEFLALIFNHFSIIFLPDFQSFSFGAYWHLGEYFDSGFFCCRWNSFPVYFELLVFCPLHSDYLGTGYATVTCWGLNRMWGRENGRFCKTLDM